MEQADRQPEPPAPLSPRMRPPERDEMIARFAPLVRKVARKVAARLPHTVELDDLVSSGVPGLIDAVDRFDPRKNPNFVAYAEIRIRGAMLDELRTLDWVPRSVRQKLARLEAAYASLEQRLGRSPTDEELAAALGVDAGELAELLSQVRPVSVVSFEELGLATEREQRDFVQCLRDDGSSDPQTRLRVQRIRETLAAAVDRLPEKHRVVIGLYYFEDLNLKEIGKILGVTESRVSQLHSQAVLMLRSGLKQSLFH